MKLENLSIPTGVMRHGMSILDFFQEAVRCNVPGIPFVDDEGRIVGLISVRDVYKHMAVPDNLLPFADTLGDQTENIDLADMEVNKTLALPVETYRLDNPCVVSPRSSIVKALALMEAHNSSYIFLVDEGQYKGVVTRMVIARRMLDCIQAREKEKTAPNN